MVSPLLIVGCDDSLSEKQDSDIDLNKTIIELKQEIRNLEQKNSKCMESVKKESSYFEKNQKCLAMRDALEKEIKDWYSVDTIKTIFYNSEYDSCLVEVYGSIGDSSLYDTKDFSTKSKPIKGCLERTSIESFECRSDPTKDCSHLKALTGRCDKYNEFIKSLMK